MGMDPASHLVYGFEFEYDRNIYEEEDEDFPDSMYIFLKKRGLSYCRGGLVGHYDKEFGIVGFQKDLTKYSYVNSVNLELLKKFEEDAKEKFTPALLQELLDFLKIKKTKTLNTYVVASYS